jgi:conserved oligomeric Golgi complex subunit 6
MVRCFIDALTRGGPGGMPRPIELHSHDPLRYLGDMLAWLHQAAASEHEHIQALLRNCSKISKSY